MKTVIVTLSCLLLCFGYAVAEAPPTRAPADQEKNADGETLLAEIRKLVEAGEWIEAFELLKKHPDHLSKPTGFEWNYFRSYLQDGATRPENSEGQVRGRAKSAELLKLHDLAIKQYDNLLTLANDDQRRYNASHGKAMSAWAAAQAAVRGGAFDAASRYLDVMRDFGQTWVSEEGGKKGNLVRKLMAEPNSIAVRMEFANGFWIANPPALGVGCTEARQVLVESLNLKATPDQRLQLLQLIQQYSFAIPDTAAAIKYTERICADFPEKPDACDQALFALAQHYTAIGQPQKASETLQRILTLHPAGGLAGMVHLGLSEVFSSIKDEPKMLEHLDLAAKMPPEETHRSIMDASDTRQVALVRLGQYYQGKKSFAKALEYFRAWEPRNWCGNGQVQFSYERDLYIAQCLVNMGNIDEALTKNLMPHLLTDQGELYCDAKIPELVVRLFEDKKDLDGLIKSIRPHAEAKSNGAAQIALGLAEIRVERRDGKIDALINRLRHSGSYVPSIRNPLDNWQAPAAARALSEMEGKEYPALRRQHDVLLEQKGRQETYGSQIWVLYAITLSQAADARPFIEALLKKAEAGNPDGTIGVGIDDIRFLESLARGRNLEPKGAGGSQ